MHRFILLPIVLFAAGSAGYAQNQKNSGTLQGAFGSPESATGGLRGVYGPPGSAAGQLPGVYAPPQSPAPTPLPSTVAGPANTNTDNGPSVTLPGEVAAGQTLPGGVTATPIPDRPGYGRATINGHAAVIDMGDHRIVEYY